MGLCERPHRVCLLLRNTQGLEYDSEAVTGTRDWEYSNPNCRLAPLSWLALPSETETSINENGLSSVEATIRVSAWRGWRSGDLRRFPLACLG